MLMDLFGVFGKIVSAKVMVDHNTGKGRGFGFVSFETPEAAAQVGALACCTSKLISRYCLDCHVIMLTL